MDDLPDGLFDNKYTIVKTIGCGGMGKVYEGFQQELNRRVALKVLHSASIVSARRMEREALVLARLNHPGVVTVYGSGSTKLGPYIAMEFVDGHTLQSEIKYGEPMEAGRAICLVRQLCEALEYTHDHGIVHRDLKPTNVMIVEKDGVESVKLIDLGLAKILFSESEKEFQKLTRTNEAQGTVHYMSPEQCLASSALDCRSDIYSVGIVLYECLTGKIPFDASDPKAVMYARFHQDLVPLSVAMGVSPPSGLQNVINKATAKSPGDRYQSMREMIEDLRLLESGKGDLISAGSISRAFSSARRPKRGVLVPALIILSAVVSFLCIYWIFQFRPYQRAAEASFIHERSAVEWLSAGNSELSARNYNAAARNYEEVLHSVGRREVEFIAAHLGLASADQMRDRVEEAAAESLAALQLLTKYPELNNSTLYDQDRDATSMALRRIITAFAYSSRPERAEPYMKQLISRTEGTTDYPDTCATLAEWFGQQKKYEDAIRWCDHGLNAAGSFQGGWLHGYKAQSLVALAKANFADKNLARKKCLEALKECDRYHEEPANPEIKRTRELAGEMLAKINSGMH